MRHLYLALLALLTFTQTYGQQDFRQGYIVQKGNTIQGYLDYRGDAKSSQSITFKRSLAEEGTVFLPNDISGYGYQKEGKIYESMLLPLSDSANAETVKTFATVLVKGKASLYSFRDQSMVDHYYLQKDTVVTKLTQYDYEKVDAQTGKTYTFTNKKYIGILNLTFNDCSKISASDLKYVSLSSNALIKITQKYNQCVSPGDIEHVNKSNKAKISIGPVLLFGYATLTHEELKQFSFENEPTTGAGISFNVVVPSLSEKLSLQTELLYVPYKFNDSYMKGGEFPYRYEKFYDLAYLKLPFQIRYTYPKGNFQPFINAGFMLAYCLKNDNRYTATSLTNSHFNISTSDGNDQKLINGVTAGGGVSTTLKSHIVSLEARFEKNSALSDGTHLNSSIQSFSVLLSYGF